MKPCRFKNFKECYYLAEPDSNGLGATNVCTACLLSRIEKLLFKVTQRKGRYDAEDRRDNTERTEDKNR
jgi:hypothetical protein